MGEPVIQVQGLVKKFGAAKALDGLDLSVENGQVHGFLGPNGAGKSTTIRVLLGMLKKTGGTALLFSEDPWRYSVRLHRKLAYIPGDVSFWPNLTGGEIIDLLGSLRGGLQEKKRAQLVRRFELDERKKFRTYSKGNRQKVAIIAALASNVPLYIFDEPTSGLDPLMENVFQDEVRALKEDRKTILLSSHILAEVEALCDTVTIINKGKTVETGTLKSIRRKHRLQVVVETEKSPVALAQKKGVHNFTKRDNEYHFEVDMSEVDAVLKSLSTFGVRTLTTHPPTLESLFLRHYNVTTQGK